MSAFLSVSEGAQALSRGEIIAYPTEAVFGLGCCPLNETALQAVLTLKERSPQKGMILIASRATQLLPYIDIAQVSDVRMQQILQTWPGPFTWVFPATQRVSNMIKGQFESVAVRVTAHPIAKALCEAFGGAFISTSANISASEALKTDVAVDALFSGRIAGVVAGDVGNALKPTTITDAMTGQVYR